MTDNKIRAWLRNWNTDDFLREQRQGGRSNLPASTIARYAAEHDRVTELLEERRICAQDVPLARMLEAITAPLAALRADPVPRYYSYTGVNVLDEYVDGSRLDLEAQKALCVEGMRGLMLDLTHFEAYSLTGIEPWSTQKLDPDVISRRLQLLRRQFHAVENLGRLLNMKASPVRESVPRTYATLEGYCNEAHPLSAIVQFTCIPSSCSHDEILFLRTIAEDELCFKAIYLAIRQAGEAIERGLLAAAACLLDHAVAFASMLHESFRVLQSMPPEHFLDFREVTGQASAVQSFNYQRLDIALFGLNPQRSAYFSMSRTCAACCSIPAANLPPFAP
jgi:hypothetical protein